MKNREQDARICCAQYRVGDLEIEVTLLARTQGVGQVYCILLEQPGERMCCEVGDALLSAKRLFFDVVYGGVTACTLADVVEDRMAAYSSSA